MTAPGENPKTDPLIYGHLLFDQDDFSEHWAKSGLSINSEESNVYPYAKR